VKRRRIKRADRVEGGASFQIGEESIGSPRPCSCTWRAPEKCWRNFSKRGIGMMVPPAGSFLTPIGREAHAGMQRELISL
jgi:hypothetical protein